MSKGRILVADTDAAFLSDLQNFLVSMNYSVFAASDMKRVLEVCSDGNVDVVLLAKDLMLGCGTDLIEKIRQTAPASTIILVSEFGDDHDDSGSFDCENLVKPFSHRELRLVMKLVFNNKGLAAENALLRRRKTLQEELSSISGKGGHFEGLLCAVERAVSNDLPVLVHGEKGTGKDTLARIIHSNHLKNYGPFISVSCCSFTEDGLMRELFGNLSRELGVSISKTMKGKVELADGGTLYIDEVQFAPPSVQIRLIHLIAEGGFERPGSGEWIHVDVRMILGALSDFDCTVDAESFRPDLYYRLQDNSIALRPLRECRDAIPSIVGIYLKDHCSDDMMSTDISEEAMQILCEYDWPGNIDELESCLTYAVERCKGGRIQAGHLPSSIVEGTELTEMISSALDEVEKRHIMTVLDKCSWNKHQAARELEISKSTLYSKISKYRLIRQGADENGVEKKKERVKAF